MVCPVEPEFEQRVTSRDGERKAPGPAHRAARASPLQPAHVALESLAAYNDVHLLLAESNAHTRREWIAALDTIEALHPRVVIAGHKRPGTDDAPRIIEETRQYIRAIDRLAQTTTTTRELYDQMLSLYPKRVNPGALWSSARALKPEEGKTASGTPWLKPEA